MPEISYAAAARVGLLLRAVQAGDRALVAEMLLSIPEAEVGAVEARLRRFGADPAILLAPTT
jgi:hypothetical protein